MATRTRMQQPHPQNELALVVLAGFGFAALFRAAQIAAEIVAILECSGAIGGTPDAPQAS